MSTFSEKFKPTSFSTGIPRYLYGLNAVEAELVEVVVQETQPGTATPGRFPASLQRVLEALHKYEQGLGSREDTRSTAPAAPPDQATPPVLRIQLELVQGKVV